MTSQSAKPEIAGGCTCQCCEMVSSGCTRRHTEEAEDPPPICFCQRTAHNRAKNGAALRAGKKDGHGECSTFWLSGLRLSHVRYEYPRYYKPEGNGGTYISNRASTHGNHGGRSKRLYDTQKDQGAIVGWDGSKEDIRADIDGDGDQVQWPATFPIGKGGPK